MKKILLTLFLLFFFTNAYATIVNYEVSNPIPLGKNLIISGQLDTNASGVICSFLIQDTNGNVVKRLTDEYTAQNGFFASDYWAVSEPRVWRETDYTAYTDCDGQTASQTFRVVQREGYKNQIIGESFFIKDNPESLLFYGGIGLGLAVIIALLVVAFRERIW